MSRPDVDTLIDALAGDARPVRPLRAPAFRALATLAVVLAAGIAAILALADLGRLRDLHAGRESLSALELAASLATGVAAVAAAFFAAVPGRSRHWRWAPLPPLAAWLLLSGVGCLGAGASQGEGDSSHCLLFILGVSAVLGPLLASRLARAAPIDPLPVALLGGLGTAALSASVLAFFHPFRVTALDLGVHVLAILLVIALAALLGRRRLA